MAEWSTATENLWQDERTGFSESANNAIKPRQKPSGSVQVKRSREFRKIEPRMKFLVVVGVCAFVSLTEGLGRLQSVGVRGTLRCGSKPLANTVVMLWDSDTFFNIIGKLACVKTDSKGRFELQGSTTQMTNIDPRLRIYTDCNDKTLYGTVSKPCQRKIILGIPDSYINSEKTVTKWFEAGVMNMELKQQSEECQSTFLESC